jgi:ATP-dependent helicase Lhr and Lhr-like helicase
LLLKPRDPGGRRQRRRSRPRPAAVASAVARARDRFGADLPGAEPKVSDEAIKQLKFAELLPPDLASHTLGARSADHDGARLLLQRPVG